MLHTVQIHLRMRLNNIWILCLLGEGPERKKVKHMAKDFYSGHLSSYLTAANLHLDTRLRQASHNSVHHISSLNDLEKKVNAA